MRMWMVDTKILCGDHLRGEHVETHMFLGILKKKWKVNKFVSNNLLEFNSLKQRHDELAEEFVCRGYKHESPLDFSEEIGLYLPEEHREYKINRQSALKELINRCPKCKENFNKLIEETKEKSMKLWRHFNED